MKEPRIGEVVYVVGKYSDHEYTLGGRYIVRAVDADDQTAKIAEPTTGLANGWLKWDEIAPVAIGWEFCKTVLIDDVSTLLSACKGIAAISLHDCVRDEILASLPDLRERIVAVMTARLVASNEGSLAGVSGEPAKEST